MVCRKYVGPKCSYTKMIKCESNNLPHYALNTAYEEKYTEDTVQYKIPLFKNWSSPKLEESY
jgi:hypothetical protein